MNSFISPSVRAIAAATLILCAQHPRAASQFTSATATSGNGFMGPQAAVDGDPKTRWSSDANDKESLTADLGSEQALVGVRYFWELARARDYNVDLSSDGKTWTTAYSVRDGDGSTDELFFGPHKARYVRMTGLRRGTGWGYSLYEVQVLTLSEARHLDASSVEPKSLAEYAADGTTQTAWRSNATTSPGEAWLRVQLPAPTAFGGIRIAWGADGPRPWHLEATNGDPASTSPRTILENKGRGSVEDAWCERTTATALRLVVKLDTGQRASVAELSLKGPDETWNPVRQLETIAKTLPLGSLPRWLSREQVYWTITGLPSAPEDSLLDEDGRVEPLNKSFSVTPLLLLDHKLLTVHDFTTTQSLAEGWAPLPGVTWTGHDMQVRFRALTQEPGYTAVLCQITNTGLASHDADLMFTIRPALINPPWQHGGFAPLKSAEFTSGGAALSVNNATALYSFPAPTATAVAAREGPDIFEMIQANVPGVPQKANDPDGLVSPGLRFDFGAIAPNATQSVLMIYPLKPGVSPTIPADIAGFFNAQEKDLLTRWRAWTGNWDLRLPDARLAPIIRSNLAYLLIDANGPAIQPGSRSYENSWIRDGAISADALLRFGVIGPVADYVKWFTPLVHDDGFVPFIVVARTGKMPDWTSDWAGEYDSFGEFAYLVNRYVLFSGDKEFAATAFPKVKAALGMVAKLRDKSLTPDLRGTEFEGILPKSNSHEGYFPPQHSYWDDFWALRGLQDGADLATMLGHPQDARTFRHLETELRASILTTMKRCMEKKKIDFIPAASDLGDLDPASTSINLMIADERDTLPHDALLAVYDRYTSETHHRRYVKNSIYTPYEFRNVQALLRLGQIAEADWLLDYLITDAVRPATWNQVAEVVHPDPRSPNYIGDMPHGWCGASLIHAVADCLLYEERGKVILAAGVPDAWIDAGMEVRNLRTQWGPISYTLHRVKGRAILTLETKAKPPNGFSVPAGVAQF